LKNAVAIALLFCFAIFHFGYYAFYFSVNSSIEAGWEDKIYGIQNQNLEEAILSIPIRAPYLANQEYFQATNTRFEKDGKYFRAIKQRFQNDTLQVVYVEDMERGKLDTTLKKWISSLNEEELPQDHSSKTFVKLFAKDYLPSLLVKVPAPIGFRLETMQETVISLTYKNPSFSIDAPPPQLG
jgi:hypothetical protein